MGKGWIFVSIDPLFQFNFASLFFPVNLASLPLIRGGKEKVLSYSSWISTFALFFKFLTLQSCLLFLLTWAFLQLFFFFLKSFYYQILSSLRCSFLLHFLGSLLIWHYFARILLLLSLIGFCIPSLHMSRARTCSDLTPPCAWCVVVQGSGGWMATNSQLPQEHDGY